MVGLIWKIWKSGGKCVSELIIKGYYIFLEENVRTDLKLPETEVGHILSNNTQLLEL